MQARLPANKRTRRFDVSSRIVDVVVVDVDDVDVADVVVVDVNDVNVADDNCSLTNRSARSILCKCSCTAGTPRARRERKQGLAA